MAAPVTPNEFKEVIPAAGANICQKILSLFRLSVLVHKWMDWAMDEDGNLNSEFKTNAGVDIQSLAAPQNTTATDNADPTDITVTWEASASATHYSVWRSTVNDTGTASIIAADITTLSYVDTPPATNILYFYWIKAHNSGSVSAFSIADSGSAGATGQATGFLCYDDTPVGGEIVFPGVSATVTYKLWSGGGGGYDGAESGTVNPPWSYPNFNCIDGGGGGSSGGYVTGTISVTAGATLKLDVGAAGAVNSYGGETSLRTASDSVIASVDGGNPGNGINGGTAPTGGNAGTNGTARTGTCCTHDASCTHGTGGVGGAAVLTHAAGGTGGTPFGASGTAGGNGRIELIW